MSRGLLVSIEGVDTAGKSTQTELLQHKLIEEGKSVRIVHFPRYQTIIGRTIKELLMSDKKIPAEVQALYVLDQVMFREKCENLLNRFDVVILDRYDLSSKVYYMSNGRPLSEIEGLQSRILKPDMTFILDLEVDEIAKRKANLDNFERNYDFMYKIRNNYRDLAMKLFDSKEREIYIANADAPTVEITDKLYTKVKNKLENGERGDSIWL